MHFEAQAERPSIGVSVEDPEDDVGVGTLELPDGGAVEAVGEGPAEEAPVAEQRLVESARAALRSSDVHPPSRQLAATDRKASVQRQAVSVSPLQPCLVMA